MGAVHTSELDQRTVGFHILQTSAEGRIPDIQRWWFEVLPTSWEEARGSPVMVRPEWIAVATEAGTEGAFHDTAQEFVGNTEVLEVAGGS